MKILSNKNKKKIKRIAVVFAIIALPVTLIGQIPPNSIDIELADEPAVVLGGMTISVGDAIKMAIKNNHNILSGAYDVAMADTLYKQLQKKYSTFLSADVGHSYSKNPPMASIMGKDTRVTDANVALSRGFSSGTRVTTGVSHQFNKTTRASFDIDPNNPMYDMLSGLSTALSPPQYHMPVFFVNVQQELLNNAFGKNDRLQDKMAQNATNMQKDMILQALSMMVVGVIVEYWNVIIAKTNMDNNALQLEQTIRVRNIVQRNVALGLADSFQVNYYNALVAGSEAALARARQSYTASLRTFLSTINAPDTEVVAGKIVLTDKLINMNEEESLKVAFVNRADYQNALRSIDNAKMNRDMINNANMPSLTANLQVRSLGQDEEFKPAYGQAGKFNYPSVSGRLALTHTFGDPDKEVRERNVNFQLRQAEIALEQAKRTITDDIKNNIDNVNTAHLVYKSAREARIQSETFYTRMLGNLQRGRLDSATVKNALDGLISSRQAEIGALVGYNISLFQFLVAKNELWEKFGIDVEEYIPKHK